MPEHNFNTHFPKSLFKFAEMYSFSVHSSDDIKIHLSPCLHTMAHKGVKKRLTEVAVDQSNLE